MIEPMKAAVRPRVYVGSTKGVVLLEDLVADELLSGNAAVIQLFAPPASGVTTALRHIAFQFETIPELRLADLDRPALFYNDRPAGLIALQRTPADEPQLITICTLVGWERDEWIEYLLSMHKPKCASVMQRIQHDPDLDGLGNNSNILSQVLDELAANDQLPDIESALQQIIVRHFPDSVQRRATAQRILSRLVRRSNDKDNGAKIQSPDHSADQLRLLYIPAVLQQLASELAWSWLSDEANRSEIFEGWPRDLVTPVARKVAQSPTVQNQLKEWLRQEDYARHSLAASLLNLAKISIEWPSADEFSEAVVRLNLQDAILDGADCTRVSFAKCRLIGASLVGANLLGANLHRANAKLATFRDANLEGASMEGLIGYGAQFSQANLSSAVGKCVEFTKADLSFVRFTDAQLNFCSFCDADLAGADLERASLTHSIFRQANLVDANFQYANLERADFRGCDLSVADFRHASFRWTRLYACEMSGMELPGADFESACLEEASLTGSIMPHANLFAANLRLAKLAEVEWESADLRHADLTNATFHMGSSRSGLVPSSIPMEGSKTGFYGDDFNEQDFKSPEEIRKANLRGADLRGAIIDGVDFYLVDLRDARYDDDQLEQLRSTGAILETHIR